MAGAEKINANPTVYAVSASASTRKYDVFDETDEEAVDPFDAEEVFGASFRRFRPIPSSCALGGEFTDAPLVVALLSLV